MIDSHTHTQYSKHATGSVIELVESAISKGIKVLTITDHAPFYVDSDNRLLESEMDDYFAEVANAQKLYSKDISILSGLELDYMPGCEKYTEEIIKCYSPDFVIGSLHYIPINSDFVKVWDLNELNAPDVIDSYFNCHTEMIASGLFDSIGHPDSISRRVPDDVIRPLWDKLLTVFSKNMVAWELNASGFRKSAYDELTKRYDKQNHGFPALYPLSKLSTYGIPVTIGSDAHKPEDVGRGLLQTIELMKKYDLNTISYFKNRRAHKVSVESF